VYSGVHFLVLLIYGSKRYTLKSFGWLGRFVEILRKTDERGTRDDTVLACNNCT